MRRLLIVIAGILCLCGTVRGQTPTSVPPTDQTEMVRALLERIDKLERRVDDLEGKLACASGPCESKPRLVNASAIQPPTSVAAMQPPTTVAAIQPPTVPISPEAPKPPTAAGQMDHDHMTMPQESMSFPHMDIRGFGDVDFSATNQPGTNSGFNLGQFVLHIASPLSKKVTYFGEISFTAQPSSYTLAVERNIIRYDYDDFFKLSFGKYHTPINYWNTEYHHGLWLQTTISRPDMIQFGGRFLPVHFVGLLGEGEIPSGGLGLNYQIGMGNGRNLNIAADGDSGDINNNRAWVLNLFSRPRRYHGLQIGGSMYGDDITTGTVAPVKELISAAHVVWLHESPEILAEFANVRHELKTTGQVFNSQAFYVQVAYRLPWDEKKWKPYVRFEHIHIPMG